MKTGLKRFIVLLLALVVQIQPLQVHAIVLQTEQADHTPGQLSHHHSHAHGIHSSAAHSDGDRAGQAALQASVGDHHTGECHPAHILCSIIVFRIELESYSGGVRAHPAPDLPFFEPSLELPPPKPYS